MTHKEAECRAAVLFRFCQRAFLLDMGGVHVVKAQRRSKGGSLLSVRWSALLGAL